MNIRTESILGLSLTRTVQLNQTELTTLDKAADILEKLRAHWGEDDERTPHADLAIAGMTLREFVEDKGRVEL